VFAEFNLLLISCECNFYLAGMRFSHQHWWILISSGIWLVYSSIHFGGACCFHRQDVIFHVSYILISNCFCRLQIL